MVTNASIDFKNEEVQDIASAVEELLQRYIKKISDRGTVKITRTQTCGSMAERTAMWKSHPKYVQDNLNLDPNYIEFDYLAIIEKPSSFLSKAGCNACMKFEGVQLAKTVVDEHLDDGSDTPVWLYNHPSVVDKLFHSELCSSIVSLCNCYAIGECKKFENIARRNEYTFMKTATETATKCDICTVYRNTGFLHIATSIKPIYGSAMEPKRSSFVFAWTSVAKTLIAPNADSLQNVEQLNNLRVNIDVLPAFELDNVGQDSEHNRFLVAKKCSICVIDGTWRMSYTIRETETFLNEISANHKKCFMVIKYIAEQIGLIDILTSPLNGYHIKTVFLNHSKDCTVAKEEEDYTKCIFSIVGRLASAYSSQYLYSFFDDGVNLIRLRDTMPDIVVSQRIREILHAITKSDSSTTADCIKIINELAQV